MANPRVSVVFSTFYQPVSLRYVLLGYERQSFKDIEVIVADDGSGEETKKIVEDMRKECSFSIGHVWQKNEGYRYARIANHAALHSKGELMIFSGGDCIPHGNFVQSHVDGCPPNGYAVGGWYDTSIPQAEQLSDDFIRNGEFEKWITTGVSIKHYWRRVQDWYQKLIRNPRRPKMRGRNISIARKTYLEINGFDENYAGFSKEDSDIRNRLNLHGAKSKSIWGASYVFHVHNVLDKPFQKTLIPRTKNWEYYRRQPLPVVAENGILKSAEEKEKWGTSVCPRCDESV